MAVNRNIVLFFTIGFSINNVLSGKPALEPSDTELIIHSGDTQTLKCQGDGPVNWTYPFPQVKRDITITTSYNEATLRIVNATVWDVGFFVCYEVTSSRMKYESSMYLYVEDDNNLAAKILVEQQDIHIVESKQFSPLIIPCKPTSPNVRVELYESGSRVKLLIKNSGDGAYWSFDSRKGFTLSSANQIISNNIFSCKFTKERNEDTMYIIANTKQIYNFIREPYIDVDRNGDYNVENEDLKLKCVVELETGRAIDGMTWYKDGVRLSTSDRINISELQQQSLEEQYKNLTIKQMTKDDEGNYTCKVYDSDNENEHTLHVSILNEGDHFLDLLEELGLYNISVYSKDPNATWKIDIKSHPKATITWFDNKDKEISATPREKYSIMTNPKETVLVIRNIDINDHGTYRVHANNGFDERELHLYLNVSDQPTVNIKAKNFHAKDVNETIECIVAAHPKPDIYMEYKPCQDDSCDYIPAIPTSRNETGLTISTKLVINMTTSGYVKCFSNNSLGFDESIVSYIVTDVEEGFDIWAMENDEMLTKHEIGSMAVGDKVTFYCAAASQNYTSNIEWYHNNRLIDNSDRYLFERSNTIYSHRASFTVDYLTYEDQGSYTCKVTAANNATKDEKGQIELNVQNPEKPKIAHTNLNKDHSQLTFPLKHELSCYFSGVPKANVIWYKDGIEITATERIFFKENGQVLFFKSTAETDEGEYQCRVSNRIGSLERRATIGFSNKKGFNIMSVIIILILVIAVLVLVTCFIIKTMKQKAFERELRAAGLINFEKGAVESLNPELGLDDQAELLPYDKDTWEIPRDRIKLGKQLGSGAFGVVMKAEVEGIVEGEDSTTVAVKMVKKNADNSYIKALASELKIMDHLGKHLNVVNLIGACTKNVTKRELLVVVEYCRFGNLHNYLLRHRENFINQVDPESGKIDFAIGADILERSFSMSSNRSHDGPPKDMMDYRGNVSYSGVMQNTDSTMICMTPTGGPGDEPLTSSNSAQPEWRSNYRGDYNKGNVKPICTKDLLTWAFEVARGMEYLASRKVLHGDLAARNILLSENNIVKICDFGLAKSMYNNDNYKKKGDGPLPIKWMSVESIRDRIFSTQSDVWSFGIVLWEFFSLARTPYPGMEADERLYQKLVDGYRMDAPTYSTKEIYDMMSRCWEAKPLNRPTFTKLTEIIGNMLEDNVKKHYIDLNDPYLVMNTKRIQEGHSDYLQMVSPPDFENLSSPQYINDSNISQGPQSAYMLMKPGSIFSPREQESEVFTFGELNRKQMSNEGDKTPELTPMLNDTDSRSNLNSPTPATPVVAPNFSNPTYNHLPPLKNQEIVQSADNYVNMPKNKSAIKNEKNGDVDQMNPHYINSSSRDWERV